jgi:hypothetical protein
MTPGDFIDDYNERVDTPEIDDKPKSRWYGGKRRTFPQHPRGEYLKLLDSMIAESQAKREAK